MPSRHSPSRAPFPHTTPGRAAPGSPISPAEPHCPRGGRAGPALPPWVASAAIRAAPAPGPARPFPGGSARPWRALTARWARSRHPAPATALSGPGGAAPLPEGFPSPGGRWDVPQGKGAASWAGVLRDEEVGSSPRCVGLGGGVKVP